MYQAWCILRSGNKKLVTSQLLRNYDVRHNLYFSQCIGLNEGARNSQTPALIWLKFGIYRYFGKLVSNIMSDFTFENFYN